ncbi:MAG TPA: energy transducer TonB [Pyrinomonadaceae bacterium]|jgi:TonB family protein
MKVITLFFSICLLAHAAQTLAPAQEKERQGKQAGAEKPVEEDHQSRAEDIIHQPEEVDVKAKITSQPNPGSTELAMAKRVTGKVRLTAVLSSEGKVTGLHVIKGLPAGLTEKALEAARKIEFIPARKEGRAVSVRVTLEYSFDVYGTVIRGDRFMRQYYKDGCPDYSKIGLDNTVIFQNEDEAKRAGYSKAKLKCP